MNDIKGATETKIEVRELNKVSDKGDSILKSVRVDITRGVIMGIIGPSGSGKSTILRALNRLWEPLRALFFLMVLIFVIWMCSVFVVRLACCSSFQFSLKVWLLNC